MPDTMYYKYGTFVHPAGEVIDCQYRIKPNTTKRMFTDTATVQTVLTIRALGCTPAEIKAREDAIYGAYSVGSKDFGMYMPDGTLTKLFHGATGPNVVASPWCEFILPTGTGEEYATKRDIQIVINSVIRCLGSQIIEYTESIKHIGLATAVYGWQHTANGPIQYEIWPATVQTIIQDVHTVGFEGYVILAVQPVLPAWEVFTERQEEPGSPLTTPNGRYYYPFRARYVFRTPTNYSFFPATPP